MSFLNPGPAEHAVERYRQSRRRERRWKTVVIMWVAVCAITVAMVGVSAFLGAPTFVAVLASLVLVIEGFYLMVTIKHLDRARQNMRAARAELLSYGLNPEGYHD